MGDQHKSHFQATMGLDYGWLLHRKRDQNFGGYHGIVPKFEISRSIRIGETVYSDYQYVSQFNPMNYDHSVSNKFIDIFVGYKQLLLNNVEGKGGLMTIGIRYKLNKYAINKNRMN